MNELVVSQGKDLISFDDKKVSLIRKTFGKSLDETEFEIFLSVAKARGLDPVLGQIHAIKRKVKVSKNPDKWEDRMAIQTGIDGFRLVAARTGEYAGCDEIVFIYESKELVEAKCTVYRFVHNQRCAFTATADWAEFYPGDQQGFMWKSKPKVMLGKCVEAQALRKAFPNDLAGLYEPAETEEKDVSEASPTNDALLPQLESKTTEMLAKFRRLGVSENQLKTRVGLASQDTFGQNEIDALNQIGRDLVNKKTTVKDAFPLPNLAKTEPEETWENSEPEF